MTPYPQKQWTLLDIMCLVDFVKEVAGNHGLRVNAIQKWNGGADGESWCCYLVCMALDLLFKGVCVIPRMGSCQAVLDLATHLNLVVNAPQDGDLIVFLDANGHAHHIGVVYWTGRCFISGNTNQDASDNGYEVAWNPMPEDLTHVRFVRVPRTDPQLGIG